MLVLWPLHLILSISGPFSPNIVLPYANVFPKDKSSGAVLLEIPYKQAVILTILNIWFFFFFPGFIPVCSLGVAQVGRMNFGKDVSTLKYFTICGLQEGYEPFAVNTNRDITMWLSKRLPQFLQVPSNHEHIEVCFFFKIQKIAKNQGWNVLTQGNSNLDCYCCLLKKMALMCYIAVESEHSIRFSF